MNSITARRAYRWFRNIDRERLLRPENVLAILGVADGTMGEDDLVSWFGDNIQELNRLV